MFDDIGGKIKTLAKVTCGLGIAASIIGAIALWMQNSRYTPTILMGALVLGLGCLGSWVGSFITYGFGQLIENTDDIHEDNMKIHTDNLEIQRLLKIQNEGSVGSTARPVPVVHHTGTNASKSQVNESAPANEEWTCSNCGLTNSRYVYRCINCDAKR